MAVGASVQEELAYHKRLNLITHRIHSAGDTNEILLTLQDEILHLFEADRITVYVVDKGGKGIVSRFKTGDEVKEIQLPIDQRSIAGSCAVTGKVINVPDVRDSGQLQRINASLKFDARWDRKTGYTTTQVLAAPITHLNYLLGVIQLVNKKNRTAFTRSDESALSNIARVLGVAFYKNQKAVGRQAATRFDHLTSKSIISVAELREATLRARKTGRGVEAVLMEDFQVSRRDMGESLSRFHNARFIEWSDSAPVPNELTRGLNIKFLRRNAFVPVRRSGSRVVVAMEDPGHLPARDAVKRMIPAQDYEFCVSLRSDILRMLDRINEVRRGGNSAGSKSIEDILVRLGPGSDDHDEEPAQVSGEDSAVVQLVNRIIMDAHGRGASDIHIEPRMGKKDLVVRFRTDGVCTAYRTLPHRYNRAIVSRVKIMADLDIAERRLPQDGTIKLKRFAPLDIELRVATIPTAGRNEDVVMRILTPGQSIPLEDMGMSERDMEVFKELIESPYGIVLVVGPTGSGKTTTLHAALQAVNRAETKIWTAEDPVEITHDGLRQVQVMPKIGFGFATAMRAFLRADPDVIMVGEMRDKETMATGIEASLTGHLVFSTLHTNSAPETITRLLDMGMDPFNFADALLGVLAQRLVRTLCPRCREPYTPSQAEYRALASAFNGDGTALSAALGARVLYRKKGCYRCAQSGYKGRTAIHELLKGTDEMKRLIQEHARVEELRAQAMKDGMTTLLQDGIRKVGLGLTDIVQVRKVCMR